MGVFGTKLKEFSDENWGKANIELRRDNVNDLNEAEGNSPPRDVRNTGQRIRLRPELLRKQSDEKRIRLLMNQIRSVKNMGPFALCASVGRDHSRETILYSQCASHCDPYMLRYSVGFLNFGCPNFKKNKRTQCTVHHLP